MRIPNNKQADHAVQFFNNLTLTGDYSYQPWVLRPWQEEIIRRIFGSLDKKERRKISTVMLLLGRKNGKSQLAAGLALYCLFCFPPGQEIISAGRTTEQAKKVFSMAVQMVRADPFLNGLCTIVKDRIVLEGKHSYYMAIPSNPEAAHGCNPSVVIADEINRWKDEELWVALTSAFGARKAPLTIAIGTQPSNRNSFAWDEVEYAKRVESGEVKNDSYLPILYYSNLSSDWTDERLWHKCNPALGDYLELEFLRKEFAIAKEIPSKETVFRQLYLNQPVEPSTQWMTHSLWDVCGFPVNPDDLEGCECVGGLDLAPVKDLSALCLVFKIDGEYKVLPYFWCCEDDIQKRSKKDKVDYLRWKKAGILRTTPGSSTDFDVIRRDINELADKFRIRTIATDQFNAFQLGQQLTQDGIDVQWFRQGFLSMSPPTQRLEKLIYDKAIHHGGHPILTWCATNAVAETDAAGNIKLSKKKSRERIDGVIALVQAIAMTMTEEHQQESVYQKRGIIFV